MARVEDLEWLCAGGESEVARAPRRCMYVRVGVTDGMMHAPCGRLPALSWLNLYEVRV